MSSSPKVFELETEIADFVADAERCSLELPQMTTGQRKQAKKLVDSFAELTCVSYGLGQERRLHIFKNAKDSEEAAAAEEKKAISAHSEALLGAPEEKIISPRRKEDKGASLRSTFIDDWIIAKNVDEAAAPTLTPSMPPQLPMCAMEPRIVEGDDERDPLSTIKESACEDVSPYLSTAASSSGSSPREQEPHSSLAFSMPSGATPGIEVRNTFVHFEDVSGDGRVVQSMPHDMFRKCLLAEVSKAQEQVAPVPDASFRPVPVALQTAMPLPASAPDTGRVLAHGTQVVINGLVKAPAFNGLSGTVQCLDQESGRYDILLSTPVGNHTTAKVKGENLLMVSPPPAPCFPLGPSYSLEQCESPLWAERSAMGHPLLLSAMV
jgi:hypothetical protein